ncbi:hypothetical protein TSAR_011426 [Trichomalopsis sarcophagae]|uniref:Uncharacterized protein n=1 Tax=Trichomalopsis sarcophagae TaxID=543379 RepID=A0A232F516_9HYME|nr:hypothetical protein TSAR_011426 [Trichomalopsis sarcophagae]
MSQVMIKVINIYLIPNFFVSDLRNLTFYRILFYIGNYFVKFHRFVKFSHVMKGYCHDMLCSQNIRMIIFQNIFLTFKYFFAIFQRCIVVASQQKHQCDIREKVFDQTEVSVILRQQVSSVDRLAFVQYVLDLQKSIHSFTSNVVLEDQVVEYFGFLDFGAQAKRILVGYAPVQEQNQQFQLIDITRHQEQSRFVALLGTCGQKLALVQVQPHFEQVSVVPNLKLALVQVQPHFEQISVVPNLKLALVQVEPHLEQVSVVPNLKLALVQVQPHIEQVSVVPNLFFFPAYFHQSPTVACITSILWPLGCTRKRRGEHTELQSVIPVLELSWRLEKRTKPRIHLPSSFRNVDGRNTPEPTASPTSFQDRQNGNQSGTRNRFWYQSPQVQQGKKLQPDIRERLNQSLRRVRRRASAALDLGFRGRQLSSEICKQGPLGDVLAMRDTSPRRTIGNRRKMPVDNVPRLQ